MQALNTAAPCIGIALAFASTLSQAQGCVAENDEIVVAGALSRETFAGPPNYESIDRGDKAETYWILDIGAPITFCPLAASNAKPHPIGSVNRFQLLVRDDAPGLRQALIARYAVVRGKIFVAHTGHHHTAALIEVSELRPN